MTRIFKGIFLLLGSLLLVVAQNKNDDKMKKQALRLHNYCTKKVDSNTEYLLAALYNKAEHTEPFKCYLQCIFDSLGLVDSNNQVNLEKLINFAPTEIHEHLLELHRACDTQPGKDSCDIVYTTSQCYYEVKPAARGYPFSDERTKKFERAMEARLGSMLREQYKKKKLQNQERIVP